jgi:hypothetical protein
MHSPATDGRRPWYRPNLGRQIVLGNCPAIVVVARWGNEFDAKKAEAEFGTP